MDRRDANLPEATSTSFWLSGSAWQFPTYENAETFVDRLVRDGLLVKVKELPAEVRQQQPVDQPERRYCRDRGRAEEMAQEALVRAWRGLATWRQESSFST